MFILLIMKETDKTKRMKEIKEEVINLKGSPLYKYRIQNKSFPVIGEGSHESTIMFIGEAPGRNEAATGKPFCGASGRILDELLEHIGLERSSVYVTNVVKDRPPENRDPSPEEIKLYGPFLDRQIEILQPRAIVSLGRFSMKYILEKFGKSDWMDGISQIHGKVFEAKAPYGIVKIIPMFHPAVVVYDASKKNDLKKDFEVLKKV